MTGPPGEAEGGRARSDVLVLFGTQISRYTILFGMGVAIALPFGLVMVAVVTRYLDPSEYGRLAVSFVFASLLTVLFNLGSLQGTFRWVFGSTGEEDDALPAKAARAGDKRKALGSGLALIVVIVVVGVTVIALFAEPIGRLLFKRDGEAALVRWAAVSGGLGSIWRLAVNIFRLELRPHAYVAMNAVRPTLVLACTIPALDRGHGVLGVVAGTAAGTALAVLVALVVGFRSYAPSFSLRAVANIMRAGSGFVAVVVGLWIVHNADIFMLSHFAPEREVGLYRLAGRVAAAISYFVSAFLMAWTPLERTSLFHGSYQRLGRAGVRSTLITYYLVIALTIVLAMAVTANILVKIAAPEYAEAADLIVPIGAGFVAYGAYIVLFRAARLKRRLLIYSGLSLAAGALLGLYGLLLIPRFGAQGAALTIVAAMGTVCVFVVILIRRSSEPIPFEWSRLAGAVALAAVSYLALRFLAPLAGDLLPLAECAIFAAFLILLVVARIVPYEHVRPLGRILSSLVGQRSHTRALVARVAGLGAARRSALEAVVRDGLEPRTAAAKLSASEDELHARLVEGLRELINGSTPAAADPAIGRYLASREPRAERIEMARRLWDSGVDALELHELEAAYERLCKAPRKRWPEPTDASITVPQ